MKTSESVMNAHENNILFIGDAARSLADTDLAKDLPREFCDTLIDGVYAAGRNNYSAIAVAMEGFSAELRSALKVLRQSAKETKIILLVRMYEEPLAMQLVGTALNGTTMADDYLVCPVGVDELYEAVTGASKTTSRVLLDSRKQYYPDEIKELEILAITDELTGLKNRRYIWEFARQIMRHAKEKNGRVTLLIFDIDNFKHYNDVYGHSAGDDILRQAAVLICRSCRSHDVIGRIGGDEFAVIFWDDPKRQAKLSESERRSTKADHPKEPVFIANRFRRELNKARFDSLGAEGKGVLTISGGLATFPQDGATIKELFEQADEAMLEAKRSGKNRIYLVGTSEKNITEAK